MTLEGTDRTALFFQYFYQVEGLSGMHHQDGIFWIRTPQRHHVVIAEKLPLRMVAPTIVDLLNMETPPYMTGRSVLSNSARRLSKVGETTARRLPLRSIGHPETPGLTAVFLSSLFHHTKRGASTLHQPLEHAAIGFKRMLSLPLATAVHHMISCFCISMRCGSSKPFAGLIV